MWYDRRYLFRWGKGVGEEREGWWVVGGVLELRFSFDRQIDNILREKKPKKMPLNYIGGIQKAPKRRADN